LKLEEYTYEVVYKKGSSNTNADALSRIHVAENCPDDPEIKSEPTMDEKKNIPRNAQQTGWWPLGNEQDVCHEKAFHFMARYETRVRRIYKAMRNLSKEQDHPEQN
jgi:hypothetical protein